MPQALPVIRILTFPFTTRRITDRILQYAAEDISPPDYSPILYIAPTPRKLDDAQRCFHRLVRAPYIPPRFSTLKQLARSLTASGSRDRIFPDSLVALLISEISGQTIGYSRILSDILKELKQHYPASDLPSVRKELCGVFDLKGLPEDMRQRLENAFGVFENYQSSLASAGYADEDDILIRSGPAVRALPHGFRTLLLDGFHDMTNAELELCQALIRRSERVIITFPFRPEALSAAEAVKTVRHLQRLSSAFPAALEEYQDSAGPVPVLSYIKYNSIEDEVEGVARHIKNLYIAGGIRPSDSVILTAPQLQAYQALFERVLTRYGLPFSMTSARPYAEQGPVRDLLCLIEAVADDFPRQKFTTFLNSPWFTKTPEVLRQWIPTVSMKSGIVKGREAWENLNPGVARKGILEEVAAALKYVFGVLDPLAAVSAQATPEVLHSGITAVLDELGFTAGDEQKKRLKDAFDMLHAVPALAGREGISLARYAEFLRHILDAPEYGRETAGIQVMEFFETRGLEPDHLYFCGLKDGDMPSKPPLDHLLPDSIRKEYGLIDLGTYLHKQKVFFLRIAGSALHRHLSYPSLEGDTVFLQSPYLPWGGELTEKVFGILSADELQARKGFRPFEGHISEIFHGKKTAGRILRKELAMPLRVTDVEAFRKCPRRFFLEKILRLEASGIAEYEIEARLLGTIFHRVMELLLGGEEGEAEMSADAMQERAALIFDETVRMHHLEPYWRDLLKEAFMELLPEIIDLEAGFRREGFMPFSAEMNIPKEEVLPGISLRGKIDRIDTDGTSFRVIDYKTGTADIGSSAIRTGKGLQLPLYAAILRARGMEVERAGIYSLREIKVKWIPTSRDRHTMDDYIDSSLGYLKEAVQEMQSGRFIARPLEEFYCNSCAEAPYCPYINVSQGPAGERHGEA